MIARSLLLFGLTFSLSYCSSKQYVSIPAQYAVDRLQEPSHKEIRTYVASLCPAQLDDFDGYLITAYFNLPFNLDWIVKLGVVYAKVSNESDFSNVLCTNVNASNLPVGQCSFTYKKEFGSSMHFSVAASDYGNIRFSLVMDLTPPMMGVEPKIDRSSRPFVLPETSKSPASTHDYNSALFPIVSGYAGSVNTTDSLHLKICLLPPNIKYDLLVTVVGSTGSSAFSTYVCSGANCIPDVPDSHVVAFDVSDTLLNIVAADVSYFLPPSTAFLLITGHGGVATCNFHLYARLLPRF